MHPPPFLLSLIGSPELSNEARSGMVLSIDVGATGFWQKTGLSQARPREGRTLEDTARLVGWSLATAVNQQQALLRARAYPCKLDNFPPVQDAPLPTQLRNMDGPFSAWRKSAGPRIMS